MMRTSFSTRSRGLSLIELMLAISVTALVAGAISGMMTAVSTGLETRKDSRTQMVRANAAQSRLSAYIAPARCVLDADADTVVIWFNDDREGDTIHASELRWLCYDADQDVICVNYVNFPDDWTEKQIDKADRELASDSNWDTVLTAYDDRDLIDGLVLVDGLTGFAFSGNTTISDSKHFYIDLTLETVTGEQDVLVSATVRNHEPPIR